MDPPRHDLDDPRYAAFAWARFRRLLKYMALVTALTAIVAVLVLWWWMGRMYVHVAIATVLGVFLTMMLASALMGLMFLSSGSGHDERIEDRLKDEIDIGD